MTDAGVRMFYTADPGALLCGMDSDGTARVILVDTQGRVVPAPHGLNGSDGLVLLVIFIMLAYLVGWSHR